MKEVKLEDIFFMPLKWIRRLGKIYCLSGFIPLL